MKLERIRWKRTKGRQHVLLDKVYDAITEEFSRDAMASLATVLAHLCIVTAVAKPEAIEAFDDAYEEARDMLSGSDANVLDDPSAYTGSLTHNSRQPPRPHRGWLGAVKKEHAMSQRVATSIAKVIHRR